MQQITPRSISISGNPRVRRLIERLAKFSGSITALALGLPSLAVAAPQPYFIQFQPSPSATVVGYMIHLGTESGNYAYEFDIGQPPTNEGTVVYNATIEDTADVYIALSSYDVNGNSSVRSNEILVAAATSQPPPEPEPEPTPEPEPEPEPTPEPEPEPEPEPLPLPLPGIDSLRLGITTNASGLISTILEDGTLAPLTLDTLASDGDLRPASCDLDGDGDSDLVLGFGGGSDGRIALVYLEDGAVVFLDSLQVGDAAYHAADGQTHPACGDIDGDGLPELVVGMGPDAEETLQVLDDHATGFAAFAMSSSASGLLSVPVTNRIRRLGSELIPALGDIDGDGRDELVVGFARQGNRHIAILDDGLAEFVAHPRVTSNLPLVRVAKPSDVDSRGGGTYPTLGDWDGDGLDEIAVGFGPNSDGWVAFLDDATAKEYDKYPGFLMIRVGRDAHRSGEGSSRPVFGDIDGDGSDELIVGFGGDSAHEFQIFEDMATGGLQVFHGGVGFVTSADSDTKWVPLP